MRLPRSALRHSSVRWRGSSATITSATTRANRCTSEKLGPRPGATDWHPLRRRRSPTPAPRTARPTRAGGFASPARDASGQRPASTRLRQAAARPDRARSLCRRRDPVQAGSTDDRTARVPSLRARWTSTNGTWVAIANLCLPLSKPAAVATTVGSEYQHVSRRAARPLVLAGGAQGGFGHPPRDVDDRRDRTSALLLR
jgi:hypothetical protein